MAVAQHPLPHVPHRLAGVPVLLSSRERQVLRDRCQGEQVSGPAAPASGGPAMSRIAGLLCVLLACV